MTRRAAAAAALALGLLACRAPAGAPPPDDRTVLDLLDRTMLDPQTTDGALALGNLEAQVAAAEGAVRARPSDSASVRALVSLLLSRAQHAGRFSDFDRAQQLSDALVLRDPSADAYLTRAKVRSALHLFAQAAADLDEAERRKASPTYVRTARAEILQATGHLDEALALRLQLLQAWRDHSTLGALAVLRAERGETAEAWRLFAEARAAYVDVSPFPLVWLELQEALARQRAGDVEEARRLLRSAHARLPGSPAVAAHLAALGLPTVARTQALLEPFVSAEDPEPAAQLAQLLRLTGDRARADELRATARTRYEALLARHPEAFADHAARFFLGEGADPAKALAWARRNREVRPTAAAWRLVADAAFAAGELSAACEAAKRELAMPFADPSFALAGKRIAARCAPATASAAGP